MKLPSRRSHVRGASEIIGHLRRDLARRRSVHWSIAGTRFPNQPTAEPTTG